MRNKGRIIELSSAHVKSSGAPQSTSTGYPGSHITGHAGAPIKEIGTPLYSAGYWTEFWRPYSKIFYCSVAVVVFVFLKVNCEKNSYTFEYEEYVRMLLPSNIIPSQIRKCSSIIEHNCNRLVILLNVFCIVDYPFSVYLLPIQGFCKIVITSTRVISRAYKHNNSIKL